MDESCWSGAGYYRNTNVCLLDCVQNWYYFSKTEAESEAFKYAKATGLDVAAKRCLFSRRSPSRASSLRDSPSLLDPMRPTSPPRWPPSTASYDSTSKNLSM